MANSVPRSVPSQTADFEFPRNADPLPGPEARLPVYGIVNLQQQRNGADWLGDHIWAGVGQAIQSLVGGILLGLGNVLIQKIGEKIVGGAAAPVNEAKDPMAEKKGMENESLKIAAVSRDCGDLLDANGKVKEAVLKMLYTAQSEEPNNYPAYLTGVGQCKLDRMKQNQEASDPKSPPMTASK